MVFLKKAGLACILLAMLPGSKLLAQTNVVATNPSLVRLMKPANWQSISGNTTSSYYKYNLVDSLPSQQSITWTIGSTKLTNLTRVGDGQCVDFIKKVTGTSNYSTQSWRPGLSVVNSSGQINTMSGGTAIATFVNGSYSSEHCMVVLRRVGNSLEVAEQNVLSGQDQAKVVSKRLVSTESLKKYSIIQIAR